MIFKPLDYKAIYSGHISPEAKVIDKYLMGMMLAEGSDLKMDNTCWTIINNWTEVVMENVAFSLNLKMGIVI